MKKFHLGVLIYFFIAAVYVTYPLIFHLKDYIFAYGDEALITWIMNWDIHAFTHNIASIYNAPFYFPYKNTLSYSDTFFTSAGVALIPTFLFKEPMIAYNINVLFSLTTLGFFTYLLVHYLTKDKFSGIVSGTLTSFSMFMLQRLPQLQVVSIQWVPLCLLFFFMFLEKKKFKYLLLTDLFFLLQIFNSILPGYFIVFSIAIIFLFYLIKDRKILNLFKDRRVILLILVSLSAVLFLTYPYFRVSSEFSYVRDIRDTINFANRPEFFLYPNDSTRLKPILGLLYQNKSKLTYDGYLGVGFIILSALTLFFWLFKRKTFKSKYLDIFSFTAIFSFVLSLGPALQWGGKVIKHPFIIPLPYIVFYYLIPGFKGIRNSARWEVLALFSMSIAIGIILSIIWKKKENSTKLLFSILLCGLVLAEFNFPRQYKKIETFANFPPMYRYMQTLPNNAALIEMPYYNWNMSPYGILENKRLYYDTLSFEKRVNGGSGFSPPQWQDRTTDFIFHFPDDKTVGYLKSIHVTHILMHKSEYDDMEKNSYKVQGKKVMYWKDIQSALKNYPEIISSKRIGNEYLYEIVYPK